MASSASSASSDETLTQIGIILDQIRLSRKHVDAPKDWERPSRTPNPGCVFSAMSGVPNSKLDSHLDGLNRPPHDGRTVRRPTSQTSKKPKNQRNRVQIPIEFGEDTDFGDDQDCQDREDREDRQGREDREDRQDRQGREDREELDFLRAQNEDLQLQNRMLREQLERTRSQYSILATTIHENSTKDLDVLTRFFRAYMTLLILFNTICNEVFKNKVKVEGYGSSLMKMFEIITNYEFCSKESVFGDFDIKIKGKPKRFDDFFKFFKNYCVNSGSIIPGSHLVILNLREPSVLRKRSASGSTEFCIFSFDIADISKSPIQAVKVDVVFDNGTTVWCGDLCSKTLVVSNSGISSVNSSTKETNCFFSYMWNLMTRQTKATWRNPHELTPLNIQMLLRVLKFKNTCYKLHKVPQIEKDFCPISQDVTESVNLTGCKCSKPVPIGISVFPEFTKNNKCPFCKDPLKRFVLTNSPLIKILDKETIEKLFSNPESEKRAEFDHRMSIYAGRPMARMKPSHSIDIDISQLLAFSSEQPIIPHGGNQVRPRSAFMPVGQAFMPAGQAFMPAGQAFMPAGQELVIEQRSLRDLVVQSSSRQPGIFQIRRWRGQSPGSS